MPNIFDHVSLTPLFEMNDWPRLTTHKEWLAISRSIIQDTIADINFDPAVEAEVSEAFTGSGLLRITPPNKYIANLTIRESNVAEMAMSRDDMVEKRREFLEVAYGLELYGI